MSLMNVAKGYHTQVVYIVLYWLFQLFLCQAAALAICTCCFLNGLIYMYFFHERILLIWVFNLSWLLNDQAEIQHYH